MLPSGWFSNLELRAMDGDRVDLSEKQEFMTKTLKTTKCTSFGKNQPNGPIPCLPFGLPWSLGILRFASMGPRILQAHSVCLG